MKLVVRPHGGTEAMKDNVRCAGCDRRDFLIKLALLAGFGAMPNGLLATLPSAVSPDMIPSKKGVLKCK